MKLSQAFIGVKMVTLQTFNVTFYVSSMTVLQCLSAGNFLICSFLKVCMCMSKTYH